MKSKTKRVYKNTTNTNKSKKTRKLNIIKRTRKHNLIGGGIKDKVVESYRGIKDNVVESYKSVDLNNTKVGKVMPTEGVKRIGSGVYKGVGEIVGSPVNAWNRVINGKDTEMCDLTADKTDTDKRTLDETKIRRIASEHPFFEGEDTTFMAIVQKYIQLFCFENENPYMYDDLFPSKIEKKTKSENSSKKTTLDHIPYGNILKKGYEERDRLDDEFSDSTAYYKFCESMFDKCLKTPPLFYEIILDAISEETIYKNFKRLSVDARNIITKRITKAHSDVEKAHLDVEKSIIDGKAPSEDQTTAKIMSFLSDDIKFHISNFIVNVLIKSIIEYKEKASEGLDSKEYTGKIKMEKFIIQLITTIVGGSGSGGSGSGGSGNNEEPPEPSQGQSGGANNSMSVVELKNISVNKLQQGLEDCTNRERLKKEFEKKQEEGPTDEEANYGGSSSDDGGSLSTKPWFLYVVFGVLAFTTTIELGVFDAPQCLTHTFI